MMLLLVVIMVRLLSVFATDTDYCTMHDMHDSAGHPGVVITCQSGN